MTEKILALIPALNAELTIGPVVSSLKNFASDVVVVDDGSSDRTGQVARDAGAIVLRHEANQGKGAGLKTGFQYALDRGFDAVITLDADGQHLPSELPKFIKVWSETGADLIVGSRRHLFDQMVFKRRIANRFSAWMIAALAGLSIDDSQTGFRLYSSRLIRQLAMKSDGFAAESEALVQTGKLKLPFASVPIELGFVDGLSTSHYRPVADTLRIAWFVIRARVS